MAKSNVRWTIQKFLQDKEFNVLDPVFQSGQTKDLAMPDDIEIFESKGFKIPLKMNESEADGLSWASDYIAKRMKKVQNLGTYEFKATADHTKNKLRSLLNRHSVQI